MSGPTSLRWRLLRSAAFAAVATQLAACGHMLGGGGRPDPAVLLIGALTIGAIGTSLTSRQRGWSTICAAMLGCQVAFHLLFTVDVHGMSVGPMTPTHGFLPADPIAMLAFHLVAGSLSAGLLARGDAVVFGLFAALRRAVSLRPPTVAASRPLWIAAVASARACRPVGALLSRSPRRGPPVALQ